MSQYAELVKALRKVADYINCYDCEMWGLGECDTERKSCVLHNAADAIEALQAEQKKTVTQIFGEEQMAWEGRCKDLMKHISDLQAEIRESMQKCAECGDAQEQKAKELQAEVRFWEAAVKGQEDGIKVLQAEVERLKDSNEELREKQTYIDHYGNKWITSAKDVPTAAYEHGYADGRDEAMAKMEVQDG